MNSTTLMLQSTITFLILICLILKMNWIVDAVLLLLKMDTNITFIIHPVLKKAMEHVVIESHHLPMILRIITLIQDLFIYVKTMVTLIILTSTSWEFFIVIRICSFCFCKTHHCLCYITCYITKSSVGVDTEYAIAKAAKLKTLQSPTCTWRIL